MVGIISNEYDRSTDDVILWLDHIETAWSRINGEDLCIPDQWSYHVSISSDTPSFFSEQNLTSVWCRRFYPNEYFNSLNQEGVDIEIREHCWKELMAIDAYLYLAKGAKVLGNDEVRFSKLAVLEAALECGLHVPKTLITNNKKDLQDFYEAVGTMITKAISNSLELTLDGKLYTSYTSEFQPKHFEVLPDTFFPLLVQEKIDKKFEIRAFFLDEDFYSMAIFSQSNPKTSIDFRRYDLDTPNRNVPFQLPHDIETCLRKLVKKLGLNTGSIDLIYTQEDEFIFLEINPSGQFGMVSYPCNYYLEKRIAERLTKYARN